MGLMTKDQVIGMVVGCAVGDALGAPYEFLYPEDVRFTADSPMIAGGMHDVSVGEWTDDTAMMLATADAYIDRGGFDPYTIADNFKAWRRWGKFGTRNYVFDIGGTTDAAIERLTPDNPYGGSSLFGASGNGSLMRIAPAIAANHDNKGLAIGEAVALALMTHGMPTRFDTYQHSLMNCLVARCGTTTTSASGTSPPPTAQAPSCTASTLRHEPIALQEVAPMSLPMQWNTPFGLAMTLTPMRPSLACSLVVGLATAPFRSAGSTRCNNTTTSIRRLRSCTRLVN